MYHLPDLPYEYGALAPAISEDIMRLHHLKHHQGYVDKLNSALEPFPELQTRELTDLLTRLHELPEQVQTAVQDQGGGHYNHSLFWRCMSPDGGGTPSGALGQALAARWGSFEAFKEAFTAEAVGLFGSGWVWLTRDLEILALPNQETPLALDKGEPLMGIDIWEHAYYLDYHNRRDEYIQHWWDVVNWPHIQAAYEAR